MELAWIVVNDIEAAIKFYTETVGLHLAEFNKECGWAELTSPSGSRLGICGYNPNFESQKAGTNAVVTITVDDIIEARNHLKNKKAKLIGEVIEVPGEVKMQTFCDADGNTFQLCEMIRK